MFVCLLIFLVLPELHYLYPLEDQDNEIDTSMPDLSYLGERIFKEPNPEVGK